MSELGFPLPILGEGLRQEVDVLEVGKPGKPLEGARLNRAGDGERTLFFVDWEEQGRRLMLLLAVEGNGDSNVGDPTEAGRHRGGFWDEKEHIH